VEVLESGAVRQLRDEFGEFMEIADAECRNLYKQTSQSGYIIILTNASGVILSLVGDAALDNIFQQHHLQPGAVWNEQRHGTNGMGTCLHAGQPVIIHRDDHFFNGYRELTCTAAPIYDPHGGIMAVLDASSFHAEGSKRGQIHTRALVQMAANFIEYKYFQRYFKDASLLSFHLRPEFLGVGTEALLALDEEERIIGANARALEHLEFEERRQLIDCPIDQILSISPESGENAMLNSGQGIASVQEIRNGRRFLAMLHPRQNPAIRRINKTNCRSNITVAPSDRKDCLDLKSLAGNDPHMAYNVRCVR
ncbi:MAG: GAF domain-containing protein, partial [Gammaproteobacteria bacterium]|nr:GAF domain-containing protein [Gammaproteobacteria bacterium]